jgi:hypothetical protein
MRGIEAIRRKSDAGGFKNSLARQFEQNFP